MTSPRSTRQDQDLPDQAGTGYRVEQRPGPAPGPPGFWLGSDVAAAAWPAFMAAGIGSLILGVILLAWPKETLTVVAVLIGAALIVAGLLRLVDGFTAHELSGGRRVASVVIGLIAIVLGLYCMRHYHVTIAALAIIVGLFWVIHGIADIGIGLFAGGLRGHGLTILAGVLSLCAGLIVLFWPTISLTVLVAVIGIWLIVYGILAAFLGFRLRRSGSAPAQ
ncbi:MAG TPA: HdeD family acid-resistance protein [Streptosporangiaceae bacterium]|nr:HdeD family acid-resistance protein [Streptosporangiaceae bacterium]